MNDVKVKREELLGILRTNRDAHRGLFLKAQEQFRVRVIEELDAMLELARTDKKVRLIVGLIEPQDHTADYDRAIRMLEMSVDEIIEIDQHSFQTLVLDEWAWSHMAHTTNTTYASGGKMETH